MAPRPRSIEARIETLELVPTLGAHNLALETWSPVRESKTLVPMLNGPRRRHRGLGQWHRSLELGLDEPNGMGTRVQDLVTMNSGTGVEDLGLTLI